MKKQLVLLALCMAIISCKTTSFSYKDKKIVDKAANWQIKHFTDSVSPKAGWVNAALYRGMAEWATETDAGDIYKFLLQIGEDCKWDMLDRIYDADDLCIGQTYFKLYNKYKKDEMISKVKQRVDHVISNPNTEPLITEKGKYFRNRWGWCDALFMAPPVYAHLYLLTNDKKYLDFCFSEFQVTVDSLYDHQDHLFYRDLRFVNDRNEEGKKIFWGRGNGWVYAALASMLELVPKSHQSYPYYLNLYLEMTGAIINCQDGNGSWHASMYDEKTYPQPENSANGFFVYGLGWGINNGILSGNLYRKAALAGWNNLKKHLTKEGKLGYVQPIGHAPLKISADMSAPYGVGAFLLAATEMKKMK